VLDGVLPPLTLTRAQRARPQGRTHARSRYRISGPDRVEREVRRHKAYGRTTPWPGGDSATAE
jgi:hypothetical protein